MDKIICSNCKHFELISSEDTKKYEDDIESYHCPLCWQPKGTHRWIGNFTQCAKCMQVYGLKGDITSCNCPIPTNTMTITYPHLPKSKTKPDLKSHMAKTQLLFNRKVINRKIEDRKREIQMAKNMQILADAATKKEEPIKAKEMNNAAIQ